MDNFPDVQQKLAAPKKLSAFEKERQAAALKQQRAEEENAAALREFEDSFANEDGEDGDDGESYGGGRGMPPSGPRHRGRGRGGGVPFAPLRSGPGSLGPPPPLRSGPGSLGPARHAPPPSHAAARPPEMPFGAEKPREDRTRMSMRNAPPPGQFAPPESFDSPSRPSYGQETTDSDAVVAVKTPLGLAEINSIHMVADYLLQMRDPARALKAEALLMRIPAVQQDERMAFLYDSRSAAGLYYRWLLWSPEDADDAVREAKRRARGPERIFSDVPIDWLPPNPALPFPDLKSLADVVTDIDYESSDEESDEDENERREFNRGPQGDTNALETDEKQYLSPLKRARLVYHLSRLPTSIARLRKGDVARVTHFAIKNAGAGAEEIVDTLLLNVAKPFCYSLAAKFEDHSDQDEEDVYEPDEELGTLDSPVPNTAANDASKKEDDGSNAKLIGIYIISDILSASSIAGVRNAWRYRQLFENGLKAGKTFTMLGRLEKELAWGRIKSEQWKRKIEVVLGTWEGWSVFGPDVMEEFRGQFFGEKKETAAGGGEVRELADERRGSGSGKEEGPAETMEDIDGVPMSDSDEG